MTQPPAKPENLPAVIDPSLEITAEHPDVQHYESNTASSTLKEDSAQYVTFQLQVLRECWEHATSFSRVMKLLKEQREVIKFRAEVYGAAYGTKSDSAKGDDFTPLD